MINQTEPSARTNNLREDMLKSERLLIESGTIDLSELRTSYNKTAQPISDFNTLPFKFINRVENQRPENILCQPQFNATQSSQSIIQGLDLCDSNLDSPLPEFDENWLNQIKKLSLDNAFSNNLREKKQ